MISAKYTVGDAVYSANKAAWWEHQGVDLVEAAVRGIRSQQGGSKVAPKEVAGKLLAHAECVELLGQGVWKTFATNIESGDLAGAITTLHRGSVAGHDPPGAHLFQRRRGVSDPGQGVGAAADHEGAAER